MMPFTGEKGIPGKVGLGEAAKLTVGTAEGTVAAGNDSRFGLMLGVNQIWQDVLSQRVANVVYTNTTGKPIYASVRAGGNVVAVWFVIDGVDVGYGHSPQSPATSAGCDAIIPAGSSYKITGTGLSSLTRWSELR